MGGCWCFHNPVRSPPVCPVLGTALCCYTCFWEGTQSSYSDGTPHCRSRTAPAQLHWSACLLAALAAMDSLALASRFLGRCDFHRPAASALYLGSGRPLSWPGPQTAHPRRRSRHCSWAPALDRQLCSCPARRLRLPLCLVELLRHSGCHFRGRRRPHGDFAPSLSLA